MKPSVVFAQHRDTIRRLVHEAGMTNPRLFGSALHGDDSESSDLDILVDKSPRTSYMDLVNLELALHDALGIDVDVRLPTELHRGFREHIIAEAVPV
jgi:predicted nucleotidyltransferase